MSNDCNELEPGDFHWAVRRREHSETPWRWEIWAAGHTKAVRHSKRYFASMSEATKEGKAALKGFLTQQFTSACD